MNVIGNSPNIVVAKSDIDFASAGITGSNASIIFLADTVSKTYKSYVPGRGINAITGFEVNKGYIIQALQNMTISEVVPDSVLSPVPADYILGRFSGTNGASIPASTETGETWTAQTGGFSILNNKLVGSTSARGIRSIATIDAGTNNVSIEIDLTMLNAAARYGGVVVRYVDENNYFYIGMSSTGNGFRLQQVVGGVDSGPISFGGPDSISGKMLVVCKDSTIVAFKDSVILEHTAATAGQSSTQFGIFLERDTYTSDESANQVDAIGSFLLWEGDGQQPPNALNVFSLEYPQAYQVFQRVGTTGDIQIKGSIYNTGGPVDIEARFKGGSWIEIASAVTDSFEGELTGLSGQGTFEIRFVSDTTKNASVPFVGIGDVYAITGQSNSVGYGPETAYSHATLKAGLFGLSYRWMQLRDPVSNPRAAKDVASTDPGAHGSYWPLLATLLMANRGVPVAFVPTSKGATSILSWQPDTDHEDRSTLYGSMVHRTRQVPGGIKAVLFHQGESDAGVNGFTGGATYKARLKTFADAVMADLGVKTIVTRIHWWSEAPSTTTANVEEINQAMVDAAAENSNILLGPDLHQPTNVFDALHYQLVEQEQEIADRWWARLNALGM